MRVFVHEEQAELANWLRPLRRRMLINRVLNGAGIGLICASVCEFVLGLTTFLLKLEEIGWIGTGFSLAFGTGIMLRGLRHRPTWFDVASSADRLLSFPETIASAWRFSTAHSMSIGESLQVRECLLQLQTLQPPVSMPIDRRALRKLVTGSLLCLAAVSLSHARQAEHQVVATALTDEQQSRIAEAIRDRLSELERSLLETSQDPSQLMTELKQQLDELRSNKDNPSRSLAALSRMRQRLSTAQDALSRDSAGEELQALGEALESVEGLQAGSQMLQRGRFGEAAQAIRTAGSPVMNREQRERAAKRLRSVAESMSDPEQQELADAVSAFADALEKRDKVVLKNQLEAIADVVQREAKLSSAQQMLAEHSEFLMSQKDEIRRYLAAEQQTPDAQSQPAETGSKDQQLAANESANSADSASELLANGSGLGGRGAGSAVADQVLSQRPAAASLLTERQLERIRGLMADHGTSEIESVLADGQGDQVTSPTEPIAQTEQNLSANAAVRDQLPPRYNNVIRRYFQSIRQDLNDSAQSPTN